MKIKRTFFCIVLCACGKLFAQGYPVFDNMGWLAAIDRFYQGYDQIMNMLTMIEQNYNQMQQAYERAKSWNFETVDFNDGDILHSIDIRDEIKDATTQVNRELTNIRQIKEAFTRKNIVINGHSYSLKDLAGIGDADRSLTDMVSDTYYANKDSVTKAAEIFAKGVTEKEAERIWAKYGLSPKNFAMVKPISQMLQRATVEVMGTAEEALSGQYSDDEKEKLALVNSIVDKAMSGNGDDLTTNELLQSNLLMKKYSLDQLRQLNRDLRSASAYAAWRDRYTDQKKQAENEQKAKWYQIQSLQKTQEIF